MDIRYLDNEGVEREGRIDEEVTDTSVRLFFMYHLGRKQGESDNYFDALREIRMQLDPEGITILCNGASKNVYPSGMMLEMGDGSIAYRQREGWHATLHDVVNIFDYDKAHFIACTVTEQEEYHLYWRSSERQGRFIKPKYNIKSITGHAKFIFFWSHRPKQEGVLDQSCFSQWWPCRFEKDGVVYSSAEQWMMAAKAREFGDSVALSGIMSSDNPAVAKDIGRTVQNFGEEHWADVRFFIVVEGTYLKFSQNPELMQYLLNTGDRVIVEASPNDSIWGIGMSKDAEGVMYPENWKGLNLLGFALMEVRDRLWYDRMA